LINTG